MKQWIKRSIAFVAFLPGIRRMLLRLRFRRRALVLMYHRVLPPAPASDSFSHPAITVSPGRFREQLAFLARHFEIVGTDAFAQWHEGRASSRRPPCLITFDDGWLDNHRHALPVLEAHGARAVVFLPTEYIGTGRLFWQERMARLIHRLHERRREIDRDTLERFRLAEANVMEPAALRRHVIATVNGFKHLPYDRIEEMLATLEAEAGLPADWGDDRYIDWREAAEMARRGVELGSHGCSHRVMTRLSDEEIDRELHASREAIEHALDTRVSAFAYPNGDHDDRVTARVDAAGYRLAFTTRPGTVGPEDDPLRLRRVGVHERAAPTLPLFFARVVGLL